MWVMKKIPVDAALPPPKVPGQKKRRELWGTLFLNFGEKTKAAPKGRAKKNRGGFYFFRKNLDFLLIL